MIQVRAGENKLGLTRCPFCHSEGDNGEFSFRDRLSAREYQISGLCQNCQDGFFKEDEE